MKILFADDSEPNRLLFKMAARSCGTEVLIFDDGESIIEWIETNGLEGIDAVFTDWHMPRKSGLDVIRCVRSQACQPPTHIVTASLEISAAEARELGAATIIDKLQLVNVLPEMFRASA